MEYANSQSKPLMTYEQKEANKKRKKKKIYKLWQFYVSGGGIRNENEGELMSMYGCVRHSCSSRSTASAWKIQRTLKHFILM